MDAQQTHLGFAPAAIALAALLSANVMTRGAAQPDPQPVAVTAQAPLNMSRLLLNALLVPALDSDAVPLRWVDPRAPSRCGPATEVRVNRAPLVAGALVPDAPFDVDWHADACRPFGAAGPRLDGRVRLTVFREDWGMSAIVEPSTLHIIDADGRETTLTARSAARLPFIDESTERDALPSVSAGD